MPIIRTKERRSLTLTLRTDISTAMRVSGLASRERRSKSQMLDILVREALNERECAAAIRQADGQKQETAQEFLDRLDQRVDRKRQETS